MRNRTWSRYGWRIEADKDEVIPEEPGDGTPLMVYGPNGQWGTYLRVHETCEVSTSGNDEKVPEHVWHWIDGLFDEVTEFLHEDGPRAEVKRKWINQPSKTQILHNLHGVNVLAVRESDRCDRVYFLAGDTISMVIDRCCLSEGWNNHG